MAEHPVIFWFRRDLRVSDHPALAEAASRGPVVPLFVDDPLLMSPAGSNRRFFLHETLRSLDESIDGCLVVRSGDPAAVLAQVAREVEAVAVFATADFGPYGRQRDTEVATALGADQLVVSFLDAAYAVAPGTITTQAGKPYKVFTPYFRAWERHGWAELTEMPEIRWMSGIPSDGTAMTPRVDADLPTAGEEAAWRRLERFLGESVEEYHQHRDDPGIDGTSRLSAYLKWGTLHPRQILARLGHTRGEDAFRRQIAWREFYADVLFDRPDSARHAYVGTLDGIELDEGADADERFAAWSRGETGFPIVDAGMRQLLAEGWMHNRVRMIVASFLVKDLHIDWTRGARWFMEHLVDGDLASNSHGWQWVAGTGTDAAPYFRVFNPTTQGVKFDPTGAYLRRWIPEIAHLSDQDIHDPAGARVGAPPGYPTPIVDHARERDEALARYQRARAGG